MLAPYPRPPHRHAARLRPAPLVALALLLGCGAAVAQSAPAARLAATVVALDGNRLDVTDASGKALALVLPDNLRIMGVTALDPAAIKPGSYVGSAAVSRPDGTLEALEVHVFPPALRGTGEGHRPWGTDAGTTMTNGTVGDVVMTQGRTMTVKYGDGGVQKIFVPPDAPVVSLEPGDRSLLVPGAHIVAGYSRADDGTLTASRLNVGRNGTVPPI